MSYKTLRFTDRELSLLKHAVGQQAAHPGDDLDVLHDRLHRELSRPQTAKHPNPRDRIKNIQRALKREG